MEFTGDVYGNQDEIMLANYGYSDGSGSYFITIDTDKCNGCGDCVSACPAGLFAVDEDRNDPLNEELVASIVPEKTKKLKYECSPCKLCSNRPALPCAAACTNGAIVHSW
jgi:NAD-dependent dihydropyrimidine dehydrogenase PreA subunit